MSACISGIDVARWHSEAVSQCHLKAMVILEVKTSLQRSYGMSMWLDEKVAGPLLYI
jgi:hypothetical protein